MCGNEQNRVPSNHLVTSSLGKLLIEGFPIMDIIYVLDNEVIPLNQCYDGYYPTLNLQLRSCHDVQVAMVRNIIERAFPA